MKYLVYAAAIVVSFLLPWSAYKHWTSEFDVLEAVGFVTGAWGVWLTVKENIWNWPIGIANVITYIFVYWKARLYSDMGLQWVYLVLSIAGWYLWLYGGEQKTKLIVTRIKPGTAAILTALVAAFTWGMTLFLRHENDSAPFLDALTTGMSLAAQYMLTVKNFENWHVWAAADVIYVGLYVYKHLYLTAILYFIFIIMCFYGLRDWKRSMVRSAHRELEPKLVPDEHAWPPAPQHPLP